MKKTKYFYIAFLFVIFANGCTVLDQFDGGQPIPEEIVSEFVLLGMSLGPTDPGPLPDEIFINTRDSDPFSVMGDGLRIMILADDFILEKDPQGQFMYAFSQEQSNGEYVVLLNHRFSQGGMPRFMFFDLLSSLELLPGMESLEETYPYILDDGGAFNLPAVATHVELWFKSDESSQEVPDFVRRWSLDSFIAYNSYLKPAIEANF